MLAAFFSLNRPPPFAQATMTNRSSSSHARWQGAARWKQGWNEAWEGWSDSTTPEPAAPEPIPDERVTTALQRMQGHLQRTKVISQRRSQKTHTEQAVSTTRGNAAYDHEAMDPATQAREWQEEQKSEEAAEAETVFNDVIKGTLEKTEALEKHVKTVTMRTESLAEALFF